MVAAAVDTSSALLLSLEGHGARYQLIISSAASAQQQHQRRADDAVLLLWSSVCNPLQLAVWPKLQIAAARRPRIAYM
jgi:hypothetical protein